MHSHQTALTKITDDLHFPKCRGLYSILITPRSLNYLSHFSTTLFCLCPSVAHILLGSPTFLTTRAVLLLGRELKSSFLWVDVPLWICSWIPAPLSLHSSPRSAHQIPVFTFANDSSTSPPKLSCHSVQEPIE